MRAQTVENSRNGYVTFGGSSDMFSGREQPIQFRDDENLIEILKDNDAVDINDGNRIGYMLDGETVQTFPVKFYAEFMLDSMHQNGQNKVYGNENDIYPFVDNHGFIGWISKDPRENNPENMKEAKRRLQKSFS